MLAMNDPFFMPLNQQVFGNTQKDFSLIAQTRNGVRLMTSDDAPGSNHDALVFLHGWTCDSAFWITQRRHFSGRRRVIVPNLRGHGPSDAPRQGYAVSDFVDDLKWQLDELGVERAIVVGHSMGGTIGLELAARDPGRITGLLMIDSVFFPSADFLADLKGLEAVIEEAGLESCLQQAADVLFLPTDDIDLRAAILERMSLTPRHVAKLAMSGHLFDYDPAPALIGCNIPVGYISASSPLADLAKVRDLCPRLMTSQALGSGHFLPLLVPDQINAMIETFAGIVKSTRSS
jgi:pimeloyl-ACP methyl ester carboxylesterase